MHCLCPGLIVADKQCKICNVTNHTMQNCYNHAWAQLVSFCPGKIIFRFCNVVLCQVMLSWWNSHQVDFIWNMNIHYITDQCFLSSITFCPPVSCYSSWQISFSSSSTYFFCCIEDVLSQRVYSRKGLCLRNYCLRVCLWGSVVATRPKIKKSWMWQKC